MAPADLGPGLRTERAWTIATTWGRVVASWRWAFLAAWLVLAGAMAMLASGTPRLLSPSISESATESSRAADLLRAQFPQRRDTAVIVVFQSRRQTVADPAYQAQISAWRRDLERLLRGSDGDVQGPLLGRDCRTAALLVVSGQTPDRLVDLARQVERLHHPGPARTYVGGTAAVYDDLIARSEQDLQQSERLSLPIALLLLLLAFGGPVAALLPVLTGLAAVTVAVALLGVAARLHTVSVFALNVSSALGLGLGIDYSLLVVNRFREELRRGLGVRDAVAVTAGSAGLATLVSGATVAIGFGALMLSHVNVLWSIGLGGAIVVGVSVLASLTLIPALLAVFGGHVSRLTLPLSSAQETAGFWRRLAQAVMSRPGRFILVSLALVLVLAAPARDLRLGVVGAESLPPEDEAAQANRIAQADLGLPAHGPVLVVVGGVPDLGTAVALEQRLRAVAQGQPVRGPADVPAAELPLYFHPGWAVYEVTQPAGDNDERTHRWLDHLRSAFRPPDVSVWLGGEAPAYQDYLHLLTGDFPTIIGTVLTLTFVFLAIAFRSLVLPLKAVLMNLLSVGAAMGVLTWGFQQGHLASVLDFQAVGFTDSTIPLIIFAGLFGLSMDYEVFLLSRVREEWARGSSNRDAVALGLERTGQVITSAALILMLVVGTLGLSHLSLNKALGVTFAVAVLLDATVIRLLLVPAMMRVLGNLNWWPGRRRPVGMG